MILAASTPTPFYAFCRMVVMKFCFPSQAIPLIIDCRQLDSFRSQMLEVLDTSGNIYKGLNPISYRWLVACNSPQLWARRRKVRSPATPPLAMATLESAAATKHHSPFLAGAANLSYSITFLKVVKQSKYCRFLEFSNIYHYCKM